MRAALLGPAVLALAGGAGASELLLPDEARPLERLPPRTAPLIEIGGEHGKGYLLSV